MRLQHVHISDYKNLKDFTLTFDNDSFLDVFVGKNGTGKSNLFEALIEIFRHLNEFDSGGSEIDFDYSVTYEIEGKATSVEWANGDLKINDRNRKTIGKTPVPDNVLVYYSGHNNTVSNLIRNYETTFQSQIKGADLSDNRYFLGIGPDYKQLLLVASLLKPDDSPCRRFICEKLGIAETGINLKLTLNRPFYARGKKDYDVENNDADDRFWKAEGITRAFLDTLLACPSPEPERGVRTEGYQASDDKYILYVDVAALLDKFKDEAPHELFERFDGLKVLEMLEDIEIPLTLDNGEVAKTSFFSDGQFQSVYIFAITELFKERHCLTLLDEPDSFLHPEWQHQFLTQVHEVSEVAAQTNHTLLCSHSAVTLIEHREEKVRFFEVQEGKPNCFPLPKRLAIKRLSSDLIKYSEQEQLLSIINAIQIENKPVLFTEGSTDPIILKEAWYKLYEEEMPFIPFYAFSCSFIKSLLTDERIHREMKGLPVFGLFDLDQAFNQWNGLNGDVIAEDPFKGMIKKWANGESYAFVIPVPDNQDIKKQAIKDEATGQTFEGESACEIEHLFYGHPSTAAYFKAEPCAGGEKICFVSDGQKTKFAKEVIPLLDAEHFKVFEPIFDFVRSKCVHANSASSASVAASAL